MLLPTLAITLLSLASATVLDNRPQANSLIGAAHGLENGDYAITNVATGKTLAFTRSDTTDFFPQDGDHSVNLEANGDGHIISGLNKCASAQWGFDKGQFDHAAVSYGCQIGSQNNGNGDMVTAKQIWLFVPVDGVAADAPDVKPVSFAASTKEVDYESEEGTGNYGQNAVKDPRYGPNSGPNAPCQHPGYWLARHPGYITRPVDGHTECQGVLDAYYATQRLAKRSRHPKIARRAVPVYTIVATDHILDLTARAITSDIIPTFGGYTSCELQPVNANDPKQQWTVTRV